MLKSLPISIIFFLFSINSIVLPFTFAAERGIVPVAIKDKSGQQVGLYKESHALVIGVSDYTGGWPDLPGVLNDLNLVQQALERQGFNVVVVKDPDRNELIAAFEDFINRHGQTPDNRLLLYFSGHGHTLKMAYGTEMGYIVPRETPNPNLDESGFRAAALSMQQMEVYAKLIQSKHALFLFDSCFSGALFSLSRAAPQNITYKTSRPVRQFVTAGTAEERVPDESIFRRQFIEALQGEGDLDKDGYLTGLELGEFLQKTVVNYSRGSQHPQYGTIRDPDLDKGDFVFALNDPSALENNIEALELDRKNLEQERQGLADERKRLELETQLAEAKRKLEEEKRRLAEEREKLARLQPPKPEAKLSPDQRLFEQAIKEQKQGRIEEAIKLWQKFLKIYPDSFEARNNLGMVYYANDQVGSAISEFEKGLSLEPSDRKIKDNLIIALDFQATIFTESKQYHDAIISLRRRYEISKPENREAIGRRIELLEDQIFAQVRRKLEEEKRRLAEEREKLARLQPPKAEAKPSPGPAGMVKIPGGTFYAGLQGKPDDPVREMEIGTFYMDKYEVTQAEFEKVMGNNPSHFKMFLFFRRSNLPVDSVTWDEADAYCRKAGKRLPTEWEWEKAAKGGSSTIYPWGNTMESGKANICDVNCEFDLKAGGIDDGYKETSPVGSYPPNGYGLYDMAGNVEEWTASDYGGSVSCGLFCGGKVLRGGSWSGGAYDSRPAARTSRVPGFRVTDDGFRCVQ